MTLPDTVTLKIARNVHTTLRTLTWEMSTKMQRRFSQGDIINAMLQLAKENPERMEEIINETR